MYFVLHLRFNNSIWKNCYLQEEIGLCFSTGGTDKKLHSQIILEVIHEVNIGIAVKKSVCFEVNCVRSICQGRMSLNDKVLRE